MAVSCGGGGGGGSSSPNTPPVNGAGAMSVVSVSGSEFIGLKKANQTHEVVTITLKNTGTGSEGLAKTCSDGTRSICVSSSGSTSRFTITNSCGPNLAAGSSCTVRVRFNSNSSGFYSLDMNLAGKGLSKSYNFAAIVDDLTLMTANLRNGLANGQNSTDVDFQCQQYDGDQSSCTAQVHCAWDASFDICDDKTKVGNWNDFATFSFEEDTAVARSLVSAVKKLDLIEVLTPGDSSNPSGAHPLDSFFFFYTKEIDALDNTLISSIDFAQKSQEVDQWVLTSETLSVASLPFYLLKVLNDIASLKEGSESSLFTSYISEHQDSRKMKGNHSSIMAQYSYLWDLDARGLNSSSDREVALRDILLMFDSLYESQDEAGLKEISQIMFYHWNRDAVDFIPLSPSAPEYVVGSGSYLNIPFPFVNEQENYYSFSYSLDLFSNSTNDNDYGVLIQNEGGVDYEGPSPEVFVVQNSCREGAYALDYLATLNQKGNLYSYQKGLMKDRLSEFWGPFKLFIGDQNINIDCLPILVRAISKVPNDIITPIEKYGYYSELVSAINNQEYDSVNIYGAEALDAILELNSL